MSWDTSRTEWLSFMCWIIFQDFCLEERRNLTTNFTLLRAAELQFVAGKRELSNMKHER